MFFAVAGVTLNCRLAHAGPEELKGVPVHGASQSHVPALQIPFKLQSRSDLQLEIAGIRMNISFIP